VAYKVFVSLQDSEYFLLLASPGSARSEWVPASLLARPVSRVWDLESGREVARVSHPDQVSFTGFSPDGQYLLTDGSISFWRPADLVREACSRLVFGIGPARWRRFRGENEATPGPCDDKR
jgi:WD40 repeat protein